MKPDYKNRKGIIKLISFTDLWFQDGREITSIEKALLRMEQAET